MTNKEKSLSSEMRLAERWQNSLEFFVEEALGIDGRNGYTMSTQQRQGAREISKLVNAKRKKNIVGGKLTEEEAEYALKVGISIMSGQGPGKDGLLAWTIMWFLFCFNEVLIPCTAPGADQLKNILWAEVSRWLNKNGTNGEPLVIQPVRDKIVVQTDKIYYKDDAGKINFAFAKTANPKDDPEAQAKTLYGLHEKYMMIVCEEAAGISEPVFKPLEGTLTREVNFIFMVFNPIFDKGFAYDSHFGSQSRKWITLHWDAEESELVSKDHIKNQEEKYGRNSNTFRTLVKGLPPKASPDALIPMDWVNRAIKHEIIPDKLDPRIAGCDPGAGGDNTVLIIRLGRKHESTHTFSSPDTMEVADWLIAKCLDEKVDVLYVGSIGIGSGVYYESKRRLAGKCRVFQVKENWKAKDEDKFPNRRNELWWKAREVFEDGTISLLDDLFLKEELWTPKFRHEGKKIIVDDKKTMKKSLGANRSPNHADALIFTFDKPDYVVSRTHSRDDYDKPDEWKEPAKARSWMAA